MKTKSKPLAISFLLLMIVFTTVFSVNASAASKTVSGSKKKKIEKICKEFDTFLGYYYAYKMSKGQTRSFDFGKSKARKKAMPYMFLSEDGYKKINSKNSYHKRSKDLFGKDTDYVRPVRGDWGDGGPGQGKFKVRKTGSKYYVTSRLFWYSDAGSGYIKSYVADLKYTINKSKKSHYGFTVNKLTIKKKR